MFWLVVDIVYVVLSIQQELWPFVLLYFAFCLLAVKGWIEWTRDQPE